MTLLFKDSEINVKNGKTWLCLCVSDEPGARKMVYESRGKIMDADIKPHTEKRSQGANSYCWVLLDKLSQKLSISAEELYREIVPDIGGNCIPLPIRDDVLETWVKNWEHTPKTKIGWVCKVIGKCKGAGLEKYTSVMCYYGSSTYDKAQMARLIDLVVQECKAQDIETKTPEELEELKARWEQ